MMVRLSKALLVTAAALYYTLVVLNNLTDYGSNYAFVHHVLLMDTTFPGNHGMWRAIHPLWIHAAVYDAMIGWEALTGVLTWVAAVRLLRAVGGAEEFRQAKPLAVTAMTAGLLLWLVAFLSVGGEWFLMWQSPTWNGQAAAFRMFAAMGIVYLGLLLPD